jgi:hypothetical protein
MDAVLERARVDVLLPRIRGEFREMPGLRLTLAQAARLWSLEVDVCRSALTALVDRGWLACRDGVYARAATSEAFASLMNGSEPLPRLMKS